MSEHDFCWQTYFCNGCGLAECEFVSRGGQPAECPEDNPYFAAEKRAEMRAFVEPILRRLFP